uniref:Ribonuclease H2 subunit B n=1 Tax=Cannabis sativa TaxID=3483 RepID=A0A803PW02_CANSA
MAWSQGFDETRLLIAPDNNSSSTNGVGRLLSLRHPKTGIATCYLLVDDVLQEMHWFKQPYSSWFLGDYVTEDGRLYTATSVDPIFIFLPIFEEGRMKKGDDLGKFRQLDEIMLIDGFPGYQHLLSIAEKSMQLVCEVKEIGSSKFFRLDDSKVICWLYHKVCQLKQTLLTLDKNYAAQDEKDTLSDAVSILGEYLKADPWLELLCSHLRLNLLEVMRKEPEKHVPNSVESDIGSAISQEKNKINGRTTRAGKQTKKAKMETESHNIKDMFSRASRRKN